MASEISIFSTCPPISGKDGAESSLSVIADVAEWSDEAGCEGILVYTDNGLADPWLVSQLIIKHTRRLAPLVAIQPVYMHPYTVAKMVSTIGLFTGRRIYLNMLAGGFKNDLIALNDNTPHDRRYDRVVEYTTIITDLLKGGAPVSFKGEFYTTENLKLTPPLPPELFPGVLLSGSSDAGLTASRKLRATAVQYPQPPDKLTGSVAGDVMPYGIRIGIIAKEDPEEAWRIAEERFPEDRKGQITHQLSMKVSDSAWHRQLSELGAATAGTKSPYWLRPFENYKTFCPYLVGSYEDVAAVVRDYLGIGYTTFIVDVPRGPEDLADAAKVFSIATCD